MGFNPSDPRYRKVENLPRKKKQLYTPAGDGFVEKSAMDNFKRAEGLAAMPSHFESSTDAQGYFHRKLVWVQPIDILHSEALADNKQFDLNRNSLEQEKTAARVEDELVLDQMSNLLAEKERQLNEWYHLLLDKFKKLQVKQGVQGGYIDKISILFTQSDKALGLLRSHLDSYDKVVPFASKPLSLSELYNSIVRAFADKIGDEEQIKALTVLPQFSLDILKNFLEGSPTADFAKEVANRRSGSLDLEKIADVPQKGRQRGSQDGSEGEPDVDAFGRSVKD